MGCTRLKASVYVFAAALLLVVSASTRADDSVTGDKGSDMILDLVITRPFGLVATVVGAAAFVVALPFTIPSGNVKETADALVKRPIVYTFDRPLGEFDRCGADRHPC